MTFCLFSRCRTDEEGYLHQRNTNIYWAFKHYVNCSTEKREQEMKRVLVRSSRKRVFSLQRDQHEAWLWLTEPDRNTHGRRYGWRCLSSFCMILCVCRVSVSVPVVLVGEVVYDSGPDAGHSPLAVVPSSCDDRELRLTQTLLALCSQRGQRETKHTKYS